jgi:hypothetical protein
MSKKTYLLLFLTIVLGVFSLAWATDLYVPSGYATIQLAIDAANPAGGDVIHVAAGSYTEHIVIDKQVSIFGTGSGNDPLVDTVLNSPAGLDSKLGIVQLTGSGLSVAEPILLQDVRINATGRAGISVGRFTEATGVSVSYLKFVNVKVWGTNVSPSTEQERGFYVDLTSSASYLVFENCAFNNLTYGWYFQKLVSADASSVSYLTATNCTFNHNNHKGIYAEKLDNASFYGCTFDDNGYDSSMLPSYFAPWCAGVDINLKAGTYSNFLFDGCIITDNGIGNSKEGCGMTLKARDDASSYNTYPAIATNFLIVNCTITGNERGVRIGEPGKNNATPTGVIITNCTINNNTQHYVGTDGTLYGDIINLTAANSVTVNGVVLDAGKAMVNMISGQTIQQAINAAPAGSILNIPAGVYAESSYGWTDFIINKNLTLLGAGSTQTIVQFSNKQHGMEIVSPASNVRIEGIAFTRLPGNTYSAAWGIIIGETGGSFTNVTLKDVDIAYASSRNVAMLNATYTSILLENCNVHHSYGWGLTARGTIGTITVLNSHFDYNGDLTNHPEWGIGFDIDMPQSVGNLIITGGTFNHNTAKGINLVKISAATITGVDASYNAGAPGGGFGISLWEWAGTSQNIDIINCTLNNNALDGLLLGAEGTCLITGVNIEGGQMMNNGRSGIFIYEYLNPGSISGVTISGVNLANNGGNEVFSNSPNAVDADYNYWGDADPSDNFYGNINYDPWWQDSAMTILGSWTYVSIEGETPLFATIQEAINAATTGDIINVPSGTYVEQLHITTENLTVQGIERAPVIIKSPATLSLSFTTGAVNKPVVFVDGVSSFTLKNVTVDGDGKGNANYRFCGIAFWNAGGLVQDVDVINIKDTPFSGSQHGIGIYAFNNTPAVNYSIALNRVDVYDFQKNALALNGNAASQNLAVNLDYVNVTGAGPTGVTAQNGIQISDATGTVDNCSVSNIFWTGGTWTASGYLVQYTDGLVLTNNTSTNCQTGVYAYANTGLELQGNVISGDAKYGILDYSGIDSIINGNSISDALYGLYSYLTDGSEITGNTFDENAYALILNGTDYMINTNSFADNEIHVYNLGDPMDMDALAAANNWPGGYFVADQIIYSSAADVIYADAPEELIKDSETQVYSIKALSIEALRGYTIQVKVPKAYFAQPTNFNIGTAFGASYYFLPMDVSDTEYWIYDVSGAMLGGVPGVTGSNVVLFTFEATSLADVNNVPVGTYIQVPLAGVELRDDQNPYNVIPCLATADKLILIDSIEPTMVHDNAGTYPSGMTLSVLPDGSGDIDRPIMNLTFADNYNLDYAMYMILPDGDTAPTLISEFSLGIFSNFDGATNIISWQLPEYVNSLTDGTYTVYYLVVDDAGNFMIYDWDFIIDITAPNPIVWIYARITPDEDESVDLKMQWGEPTVPAGSYASAWVYDYDLSGGAYPEYNPAGFTPTIPGPPNPYDSADQNGWHRIYYGPFVEEYTWDAGARSYFYFTVFAQDASGNYSAAPANPFYRESLSYWPGDVVSATDPMTTSVVTGADIAALSAVWGFNAANPAWNPIIDVGPSVGYYRTGRPTPDDVINIEDLMMFAMNWKNTNYLYYGRSNVSGTKPMPIGIQLQTSSEDNLVRVDFVLNNNNGQLKGLNIPVLYGSGLVLQSVQSGSIWSESSLLLYTNENNILEVSVCELGGENFVSENGIIATAYFSVIGSETGFALQRMIARNIDNSDIGILNNPNAPTEIEDIIVPVPQNYILGNNYPNPFNPNTTISFGMKEAGYVKVTVFNSRGQVVRTLVDTKKDAGYHQVVWNGRDNNNHALASGMYFYRMEANGFAETKKALLMK